MPLGTEVGLSPGDIVLDGDPAPSPSMERGIAAPIFWPMLFWLMSIVAKWSPISATAELLYLTLVELLHVGPSLQHRMSADN